MLRDEIMGRPLVVLGAGREALAALRAFAGRATEFVVFDEGTPDVAALAEAAGAPITVLRTLDEFDAWIAAADARGATSPGATGAPAPTGAPTGVVITSPGIPRSHPWRTGLAERGWPITSGTDLWLSENAGTSIGVTGSKGKSTTSSLIAHLLAHVEPDVQLGGNIGVPPLDLEPGRRTVLELSSYQSSSVTTSPDVVVLTSLFPEHLDWHGGVERYYDDKLNLAAHSPRTVVVNALDETLVHELERRQPGAPTLSVGTADGFHVGSVDGVSHVFFADEPLLSLQSFALLGAHNAVNLTLAVAAVWATGVPLHRLGELQERVDSFRPLTHRLEPLDDPQGIVFIDDLLSTSPFGTIKALDVFEGREVTLVVGGHDRGVDQSPLVDHLRAHPVHAVLGMPDSGARIVGAISTGEERPFDSLVADMDAAVLRAREITRPGGVVLFSPAASSYNVYKNHEVKAADLRRAIAVTAPE